MNSGIKSLFLTGATGMIGGGILRHFLKNNWTVTCVVRDVAKAKHLQTNGVTLIEGNLEDRNFLLKESQNHDAIIHTAEKKGDSSFMIETTKVLLESAQQISSSKSRS